MRVQLHACVQRAGQPAPWRNQEAPPSAPAPWQHPQLQLVAAAPQAPCTLSRGLFHAYKVTRHTPHVTRHTSHVTRSRAHSPAFPLRLRPQVLQPRFCNIHQLLGRLLLPRDEPGCSVMLQKYTGTAALRASARAGSPSNLLVLVNHVANSRAPVLQCRSFSIQRAVLPAHLVDFPP